MRRPFSAETLRLLVATVPTAVIALLLKHFAPELLYGKYLAFGFMLTAVLLVLAEYISKKSPTRDIGLGTAGIVGAAQGVAVLPGVSRSGATIATLLMCGVDRERAAKFSFLMSIPIILAGAVEEGASLTAPPSAHTIWLTLVGVAAAFLVGLLSLRFLTNLIKKRSLIPFAVYTAALSIIVLIFL